MSSWSDYYQNRINNQRYIDNFQKRYHLFLSLVDSSIKTNDTVLESGCGTGLVTRLLKSEANYHCYDIDQEILGLSKFNLTRNVERRIFNIVEKRNTQFNIIYSHGVLEHFSNSEIQIIVENQKRVSDKMIHYVPSYKYGTCSFGNERLLTVKQWMEICRPDQIIEFNNGFDYILEWK